MRSPQRSREPGTKVDLWAFGVNLNDILIPRFKNAFALSDFQSSFIQVAFFSGYCLAALPAGRLMERIGYKRGILTGLALCASETNYFSAELNLEQAQLNEPLALVQLYQALGGGWQQ